MPVLLVRLGDDEVARLELHHLTALLLNPAAPAHHIEHLAALVRVPMVARPILESHDSDAGRLLDPSHRVQRDLAAEPVRPALFAAARHLRRLDHSHSKSSRSRSIRHTRRAGPDCSRAPFSSRRTESSPPGMRTLTRSPASP